MKLEKPRTRRSLEESAAINTRAEERKVIDRIAIGPNVVYETIRREGEEEFLRTSSALGWSGLAAGLSMGFSLVAKALLAAHPPHAPWTRLISKLGYSVGFLIVILGRQQLFTETNAYDNIAAANHPHLEKTGGALRIWSVIWVANLVGTFLFAFCVGCIVIFDPVVRQALADVCQEGLGSGFLTALVRGIFAGWLIALTVWLLPSADTSKISIIIILTYLSKSAAARSISTSLC